MIAKKTIGTCFRGALKYDCEKAGASVLATNLASRRPGGMAKECAAICKLRPQMKRAVLHVSISAGPGERLSDHQWTTIGMEYLQEMGFCLNQYVITRHTDTQNEHIHIVANRVRFDGTVTSDSNDYRRQERVMRRLEREYSLMNVRSGTKSDCKTITQAEVEKAFRLGERPSRMVLQELVERAILGRPTTTDFVHRLEASGVCVFPNIASTGRMNGFSFGISGLVFSGTQLGQKFKWSELRRNIDYEQDRDGPELTSRRNARRDYLIKESRSATYKHRGVYVATAQLPSPQRRPAKRPDIDSPDQGYFGISEFADHVDRINELQTFADRRSIAPTPRRRASHNRSPSELSSALQAHRSVDRENQDQDISRKIQNNVARISLTSSPESEVSRGDSLSKNKNAFFANSGTILSDRIRYRKILLDLKYGKSSELLARYWRVQRHGARTALIFSNRLGRVTDTGVAISASEGNAPEVDAMIELVKLKGWTTVRVTGTPEFKLRAIRAALYAGIKIQPRGPEDVALIAQADLVLARVASQQNIRATPKVTRRIPS